MAIINWSVSDTDRDLIDRIVDRAMRDMPIAIWYNINRQALRMDITATHANGNPLDLARLLNDFPAFDFSHDIAGIVGHLNRSTGKLEDWFVPRCTARQSVPE